MNKILSLLTLCASIAVVVPSQAAQASEQSNAKQVQEPVFSSAAHNTVQQVITDLLTVIKKDGALVDSNPEAYYSSVDGVLGDIVDFEFISGVVMGRYGSAATPAQKQEFEKTFRRGLVVTYARGMVGFADQEMIVLPPEGDVAGQRRVSVRQQVRADDGSVYILAYTMALHKESNRWKLINVVMNGINLGKTFRSQFEQAVKKNDGNLDNVINNWLSSETKA